MSDSAYFSSDSLDATHSALIAPAQLFHQRLAWGSGIVLLAGILTIDVLGGINVNPSVLYGTVLLVCLFYSTSRRTLWLLTGLAVALTFAAFIFKGGDARSFITRLLATVSIGTTALVLDSFQRSRGETRNIVVMAQQLRQLSVQMQSILDSAGEGIYGISTDGKTTFVNPAAARMCGYEPGELLNKLQHELIHHTRADGTPYPITECPIYTTVHDGITHRVNNEVFWRKDGSSFPVEYSSTPIRSAKGEIIGAVVVFSDITQRKLTEQTLTEQASELKRSNEELGQFAYVASHDLQEPLRMVASYTQLIGKRYKGKLDQSADEFIHFAVDGAQRMQTLINDLLQYSRVGTRAKPFEPTDLNKVTQIAMLNLKVAIEESSAKINFPLQLPTIHGDATQLTQLFQNLIGNAIKFHRENVPPVVDTTAKRNAADNAWEFAVRDNGIGIAPEHHDRIFIIFQRLHTREQYAGTGIGLAVCRKIVERHGGKLSVESAPDQGATFSFDIPDQPMGASTK
ncbi:MAG TPA: ATP-binding protein [Tepidisphaeraceae bacterium]|nr:ATP-binding protein [Tepidisphaeraceae bacterium]